MEEEHCIGDSIYSSRSNSLHFQACASDCRARFWTSLASKGEDYDELCQAFSKLAQNEGHGLPMLYCCDSQLCEMGVMGDADINLGISRVLSSCQSEGYDASTSPADPDQAHVLSKSKRGREDARRENTAPARASTTATPSGFLVEGFHTITAKTSPPPANEIVPGLTASDSHVLRAVTTEASTPLRERAQDTSKVPSGTKVTIGVSVMVGILAVVALIAWHMRIRIRLRNKKRISRPVKPSSLPPTPLISPSSSYAGPPTNGPLTPPARLQERRFLLTRALSLRRSNYRRRRDDEEEPEEWSAVPLAPMPPLTPPSASRPAKRPVEQDEPSGITATTTISTTTTAPPRPPRNDIPPAGSLSSVFSRASTLRAVASNASSDSAQFGPSSIVTAMELPRQPTRVYETPPVIRGLASPGPPPNRALPSLPADGRRSPLRSPLASPKSPTRRASPSSGAAPRPSLGANEGNGCPRKSREESGGDGRTAGETGLQSTRRAKHARSPLLNEVCLNSATKTD